MKQLQTRLTWMAFFLLLAGGLLSGCIPIVKAQFELKIGLNESWEFVTTLFVSPEVAQSADESLQQRFSSNEQGVKITYQRLDPDSSGNVPLRMTAKGQGYERLNNFLGQQAITPQELDGEQTLLFRLNLGLISAEQTEFTLRAGQVLSSNGQALDASTLQWVNFSGEMQAQTRAPSWMDFLPWILLAAAALILALMIVLVTMLLRPRRKPAPAARPLAAAPARPASTAAPFKVCPACRAAIPSIATFCPMCGVKQSN